MDNKEKYVYNCYLEVSRKLNDKPFRYRKDFSEFEEKPEYVEVAKLSRFFDKFNHINIKDFFEAPFFVYNEKYFDISFYNTQKAIKAYTLYEKSFIPNNPDHEQTLQKLKDSLVFACKFCRERGIKLKDYPKYISEGSKINDFLIHLKERKICIYTLFLYDDVDKILSSIENDIKQFMFGDEIDKIMFYRTKYYNSDKAKTKNKQIYNKLTTKY